ncbi:MAG: hypothetical protein NTW91_10615, partial [Verrucomicrobia bacterium]|nr:hypothetical protein [Verrucomicrobiota bacterium]
WAFSKSLGITGFILALTISKLLLGLVPSLFYLHGVFGRQVWTVFWNAQIRPLVAVPLCVASTWITGTYILLQSGWGSLIVSMAVSTAASMGCVALFGVSRELRNELVVKVKGVLRMR